MTDTTTFYTDRMTVFYIDVDGYLNYVQPTSENGPTLNENGPTSNNETRSFWSTAQKINNVSNATFGVYAIYYDYQIVVFYVDGDKEAWCYIYGSLEEVEDSNTTETTDYTITWSDPLIITNIHVPQYMITAQIYTPNNDDDDAYMFVFFADGDGGQISYIRGDMAKIGDDGFLESTATKAGDALWSGPGSLLVGNNIYIYYEGGWDGSKNPIYCRAFQINHSDVDGYTLNYWYDYKYNTSTSNMPWPIQFNGDRYYAFTANANKEALYCADDTVSCTEICPEYTIQPQGPSAIVWDSTLYVFYLKKGSTALHYQYTAGTSGKWTTGANEKVAIGSCTPCAMVRADK